MVNKEPRPCCICGLQFDSFGHNPEPFDGDIGMCCDDCDNRWVTPVRILFGRDGLDRFVPPSHPGAPLLHGFLVRIAEKAHGTGRRVEGFCREGARVVIVDDVCTTGASTINAIEAAYEAGMVVAAVVCIVEREEANGRPAVEAAAKSGAPGDRSSSMGSKPAPFLRLFTANDVRAEHVRQLEAARS